MASGVFERRINSRVLNGIQTGAPGEAGNELMQSLGSGDVQSVKLNSRPFRTWQTRERRSNGAAFPHPDHWPPGVSAGRWSLPPRLSRAVRAGGSQFETRSMAATLARVPAGYRLTGRSPAASFHHWHFSNKQLTRHSAGIRIQQLARGAEHGAFKFNKAASRKP